MSKKSGYSRTDFFGTVHHYDSKGHKVGESRPSFFGGYSNYDAKGHKVGESRPAFFGGYNNYDTKGHKVGSTSARFLGSESQYDAKGHKVGSSSHTLLGNSSHYGNMDLNSAGGAAGSRQEELWLMAAAVAAEENPAKKHAAPYMAPSSPASMQTKVQDTHVPGKKESGQEAPRQKVLPKNLWYIIASDGGYYRTEDDTMQVGDRAEVTGTGEVVDVQAVIECMREAMPTEAVMFANKLQR